MTDIADDGRLEDEEEDMAREEPSDDSPQDDSPHTLAERCGGGEGSEKVPSLVGGKVQRSIS